MNKIHGYIAVSLLLGIGIYAASSQTATAPVWINDEDVQALVKTEKLHLITHTIANDLPEPFAIILYESSDKMGTGIVTTKNDKLQFQKEIETNRDKISTVKHLGRTTGYPYTAVVVNDRSLLQPSNILSVQLANGYTEKISLAHTDAHVFIDKEHPNSYTALTQVQIKNSSGKSLYAYND